PTLDIDMSYIGIDIGTSGIRACAIDDQANQIALSTQALPSPQHTGQHIQQDAMIWWQTLQQVLAELFQKIDPSQVRAIAVDGTSGTVLVTDNNGIPLAPALMYNDAHCKVEADKIKSIAPAGTAALGTSSGLAKALYLLQQHPEAQHILHQADWIAGMLCDQFGFSDENNSLKTGYDPTTDDWPDWIKKTGIDTNLLPEVVPPGTVITSISQNLQQQFNLPADVKIIAGTTDSIAAFIATGASLPGQAVTSLGSTLVLKIICEQPVFSAEHGIYSHKLGKYWLAGGASNSGGAVLKHFFSDEALQDMTSRLHPERLTGLDYYPLLQPGERFPQSDPQLQPQLHPRPADDVEFFQGMLEGIARIEQQGYNKLNELGAPIPTQIITAGGGSRNLAWNKIRQNMLSIPVTTARHSEASYGCALLAQQALISG
ncbi:MAG TPA: FGGY-family carbohydrate kinase, partial [Gammaproteobacteria bacterium]